MYVLYTYTVSSVLYDHWFIGSRLPRDNLSYLPDNKNYTLKCLNIIICSNKSIVHLYDNVIIPTHTHTYTST